MEGGATTASLDQQRVRLRLVGGFSLVVDERRWTMPFAVQRLLAFLALHPGPLSRAYVAGSLWPDARDDRASATLRATLWRVRPPRDILVVSTPAEMEIAPEVDVDHDAVVAQARRVLDGAVTLDELDAAELLPGWTDDWVLVARERLRQLRLHALEALSRQLTALGWCAAAIDVALSAVAVEPLRESAHRALVEAHLAEGNLGEAIRVYDGYRRLLDCSLGLAPSPLMQSLVRPLLPAGDARVTLM